MLRQSFRLLYMYRPVIIPAIKCLYVSKTCCSVKSFPEITLGRIYYLTQKVGTKRGNGECYEFSSYISSTYTRSDFRYSGLEDRVGFRQSRLTFLAQITRDDHRRIRCLTRHYFRYTTCVRYIRRPCGRPHESRPRYTTVSTVSIVTADALFWN